MTGKKTMKPKVLIVDDDVAITQQLYWTLCDEFEVMTANSLSLAIRRGADGFFDKPLDVERLLSTVRRTAVAARLAA